MFVRYVKKELNDDICISYIQNNAVRLAVSWKLLIFAENSVTYEISIGHTEL